jgi:hypothetical protein
MQLFHFKIYFVKLKAVERSAMDGERERLPNKPLERRVSMDELK